MPTCGFEKVSLDSELDPNSVIQSILNHLRYSARGRFLELILPLYYLNLLHHKELNQTTEDKISNVIL